VKVTIIIIIIMRVDSPETTSGMPFEKAKKIAIV
jgi:hypothetical protein